MEEKFYVYAHYKPNSDIPFYIGKGYGMRAFYPTRKNKHWTHIVKKHGIRIEIMYNNLSETLAFQMEKDFIKMWGRADLGCGPLVNRTDGGDGDSGRIVSEKTRSLLSESHKGHRHSLKTKEKMKNSHRGQKAWNKGKIMDDDFRKSVSDGHRGQKAWNKGIPRSKESIRKSMTTRKRGTK